MENNMKNEGTESVQTEQDGNTQITNVTETRKFDFTKVDVEDWLGTDEGKKFFQPKLDRNFNKGLDTWRQNNLQNLVDLEVEKRFPTDPQEIKIRLLQKELKQRELKESVMAKLRTVGLPFEFADFLTKADVESSEIAIEGFSKLFHKSILTLANIESELRFKGMDTTPSYHGTGIQTGMISREQLDNMTYEERVQLFNQNPEIFSNTL